VEQLEPIIKIIALTMGVAWASGINLYAAILVLLVWLLPKFWRGVKEILSMLGNLFRPKQKIEQNNVPFRE